MLGQSLGQAPSTGSLLQRLRSSRPAPVLVWELGNKRRLCKPSFRPDRTSHAGCLAHFCVPRLVTRTQTTAPSSDGPNRILTQRRNVSAVSSEGPRPLGLGVGVVDLRLDTVVTAPTASQGRQSPLLLLVVNATRSTL